MPPSNSRKRSKSPNKSYKKAKSNPKTMYVEMIERKAKKISFSVSKVSYRVIQEDGGMKAFVHWKPSMVDVHQIQGVDWSTVPIHAAGVNCPNCGQKSLGKGAFKPDEYYQRRICKTKTCKRGLFLYSMVEAETKDFPSFDSFCRSIVMIVRFTRFVV